MELPPAFAQFYEEIKSDPLALERLLIEYSGFDREYPTNSMDSHSQHYMLWAFMHAQAEADERSLKNLINETILPREREQARKELPGRPTKDQINDIVVQKEDYQDTQEAYNEAQKFTLILKEMKEAMKQRGDMMRSLNSRQKAEL